MSAYLNARTRRSPRGALVAAPTAVAARHHRQIEPSAGGRASLRWGCPSPRARAWAAAPGRASVAAARVARARAALCGLNRDGRRRQRACGGRHGDKGEAGSAHRTGRRTARSRRGQGPCTATRSTARLAARSRSGASAATGSATTRCPSLVTGPSRPSGRGSGTGAAET